MVIFSAHYDDSGLSPHPSVLNLVTFTKTLFINKVIFTRFQGFDRNYFQEGAFFWPTTSINGYSQLST
jgi:hypothetical protein